MPSEGAPTGGRDLRPLLETRLQALQAQQHQLIAQANACAGAIEFCQQLLQDVNGPSPSGAGPEAEPHAQ
jgi:hypothetical protein